jgi:hypothetical protein
MVVAPALAGDSERVVKQLRLPNGTKTVVVAEGELEPRSVLEGISRPKTAVMEPSIVWHNARPVSRCVIRGDMTLYPF